MDIKHIIRNSNLEAWDEHILYNEPMSKHTSFKIGGPAEVFIKAESAQEVKEVAKLAKKHNIPLHIIGNGSNLLVKDEGIQGIVLKPQMRDIKIEQKEDYVIVTAESGALMGVIAHKLLEEELTGFEELAGIPGTIGGAVKMNAGAHGKEIKDVVIETTYIDMDGNIKTISNDEQQFEYRGSIFVKEKYIILETKLKLEHGNKEKIKAKMEQYATWRKEHQPLDLPNAGSTFKRGNNFVTAKVIDECGLKGYKIGGAQVSTKHAGFIVNTGNATAQDVLSLADYVKTQVFEKTGMVIELEIQVL